MYTKRINEFVTKKQCWWYIFTNTWIRIIIVWRDPVWRGWVSDNWWGCVFTAGLTTIPSLVSCNWELGVCLYTRNESSIHRGNNLKQFFLFALTYWLFRHSTSRCSMFRQGTKSRKDLWHIYSNINWKDQIYKDTHFRVKERLKYYFFKDLNTSIPVMEFIVHIYQCTILAYIAVDDQCFISLNY